MPIGKIKDRMFKSNRIGVIRLGELVPGKNGPRPENKPYFVLKDAPDLVATYGEKPTELDIMFTSNDEDMIVSHYLTMYKCKNPHEKNPGKRKHYLMCRGEGPDPQTGEPSIAYWHDVKNPPSTGAVKLTPELRSKIEEEIYTLRKQMSDPDVVAESKNYLMRLCCAKEAVLKGHALPRMCHGESCPDYVKKQCKPLMNVLFMVIKGGNFFGEYVLSTTSKVSMTNILNCIEGVKETIRKVKPDLPFGRIANIPLRLSRYQKQTKFIDKNGEIKFSDQYPLKLDVNKTFADKFAIEMTDTINKLMFHSPSQEVLPAPDLAGSSPIQIEAPADLYPTEEDCARADEHEKEQKNPERGKVDDKVGWLENKEVLDLMAKWEEKTGKKIPTNKRKATVLKYDTIDDLKDAIRNQLK